MIGKMDRTKMNNEERVKRNEIKGYHKFVKEFLRWNGTIKSLMTNIEIKSNSKFFKIALSIIKSHGGKKILDFCAGNCWASCTLTNLGYNVVALDMNISNICGLGTIKEYKEKTGVCLTGVVGDCEYVPFKENTFDIAFCHHALHHAYGLDKMVEEISSTVKENGLIIATCEHSRSFITSDKKFREKHEAVPYGVNEHALTVNRYKNAFKKAGIINVKILPCDGWDNVLSTKSSSIFKDILRRLIRLSLKMPILKILAQLIFLHVISSTITIYGIIAPNKTLILVNNINNTKKLKKYLKTNRKYTVVALTTEDQKKIERENIYCKTLSDYLTDKVLEEIRQNTRLWIKTWPKTKINGKSFIELVSYSDTSLWWFTEHMMYNSVETSIENIELVKHLIDKEKANEILIFGNSPLEEILHTFSGVEVKKIKEKRLNMKLELDSKHLAKDYTNFLWNFSRIYDLLKSIVAKIIVNMSHNSNHEFKRTILISTHNLNWRTVYDSIIKQPRTYDSFFDSIIRELEKADYKLVTTFPLSYLTTHHWTSFVSGLKATIGRRKYGIPHKPFEYYLTIDIDKKANAQRRELLKIWNELKNNERFKNSMNYKDVNLWPLLKSDFLFFFSFIAGAAIKHIETASCMIDREKLDLFLTGGSAEAFCDLSLTKVCARNNIPTLEIQHGIITHPVALSMHPKKNEELYKIAAFGPYYRNILLQANEFPSDSVVVTGQPRYDILYHADAIYNKKEIFKKNNFLDSKKIVLWITQGLPLDENKKNILAVYTAIKSLKNVQLVIKLHPDENQKAPQYKKDKSFKPIILGGSADTYALLYACDLMITKNSTTTIEALALNKPVIVLNFTGEPDVAEYVKEGIALGVYTEEDLKPAIEKLLKDDSELAKNREKFIEKYIYKIDGKATERVVNLIKEMIKESKRDRNERLV